MSGKSLRLHFKGEKPAKKKSKSSGSSSKKRKAEEEAGSDVEDYGGADTAWVAVERASDLAGPSFLYQSTSVDVPFCLSVNATLQRVEAASVAPPDLTGQTFDGAEVVAEIVPQAVHHVWVATRVADSDKWNFRSAEGKFLSCDRHGAISASSDARGPQEEWEIAPGAFMSAGTVVGEDAGPNLGAQGVALRSYHGGYLTLDEVAGGKMVVRGDAENVGASETWNVRVQWKFRHEVRNKEHGGKGKKKPKEETRLGIRSTFTGGSAEERRELQRANREGKLAEAMLDIRAKQKSDRYAK